MDEEEESDVVLGTSPLPETVNWSMLQLEAANRKILQLELTIESLKDRISEPNLRDFSSDINDENMQDTPESPKKKKSKDNEPITETSTLVTESVTRVTKEKNGRKRGIERGQRNNNHGESSSSSLLNESGKAVSQTGKSSNESSFPPIFFYSIKHFILKSKSLLFEYLNISSP